MRDGKNRAVRELVTDRLADELVCGVVDTVGSCDEKLESGAQEMRVSAYLAVA